MRHGQVSLWRRLRQHPSFCVPVSLISIHNKDVQRNHLRILRDYPAVSTVFTSLFFNPTPSRYSPACAFRVKSPLSWKIQRICDTFWLQMGRLPSFTARRSPAAAATAAPLTELKLGRTFGSAWLAPGTLLTGAAERKVLFFRNYPKGKRAKLFLENDNG